jgi:hypothetical protein
MSFASSLSPPLCADPRLLVWILIPVACVTTGNSYHAFNYSVCYALIKNIATLTNRMLAGTMDIDDLMKEVFTFSYASALYRSPCPVGTPFNLDTQIARRPFLES